MPLLQAISCKELESGQLNGYQTTVVRLWQARHSGKLCADPATTLPGINEVVCRQSDIEQQHHASAVESWKLVHVTDSSTSCCSIVCHGQGKACRAKLIPLNQQVLLSPGDATPAAAGQSWLMNGSTLQETQRLWCDMCMTCALMAAVCVQCQSTFYLDLWIFYLDLANVQLGGQSPGRY